MRDLLRIEELESRTFVGCAPAWKPDGTFTYVEDGAVVAARFECLGTPTCARVLLSRRRVARELAPLGRRFGAVELASITWLTGSSFAAVARSRNGSESVLVSEDGRRVALLDFLFERGTRVRAIPSRGEMLVGGPGRGFFAFDRRGRFVSAERVPFSDAAAVASSPDGRWLALARPGNVCIHPQQNGRTPVACIPIDAVDVAWR